MKKKKKKEKQNTHKTETDNGTRKKIELSRKVDKSTTISFARLFFFARGFLSSLLTDIWLNANTFSCVEVDN